ncbi:TetR/AcrR family transcriptional regulator [Dongia sp.]|uniref:TetR/AcrR family transcriptional regulator n=1 Tax=Dongia sp. TaxID=1977262 RepID=UPI00374FE42B
MTVLPRRDWRNERRQKILGAAAELFGANPYDSVQMRDVAARAEVGKPTLYRYFPSKEELFLEVFKSGLDRLDAEVAAILKDRDQPGRSLERLLQALLNALGGQVAALRMLTDDQSAVMRRWRNEFRRRRRPFVEAARTILEQGIASGEFRSVDLETVPSMLIGIVRGGLIGMDRVPRDRFAAAMIDLVMHALLARAQATAAHAA